MQLKTNIFSLFLIFLFIIFGFTSFGQFDSSNSKHFIRGSVLDGQKKFVLSDVSVTEINENERVVSSVLTDADGNFAINAHSLKNKLVVSFIGYISQSKSISTIKDTVIVFRLINDHTKKSLEDVSIVAIKDNGISNGSGMKIKKRDVTTSVATINASVMQEMQAASIDQMLQGRLPGVDIAAVSGDPGVGMQIRIRGTSSINAGSDPLIVLDGMPYSTTIPSDFNFASSDEQGYAQLLNISPADIQDITVLKDAAATAVWGARGANGVLVINTKRGIKSDPQITYTFKGTISKNPSGIPMLSGDQYSQLIPEAYMNRTGATLNTQTNKEFAYDPTDPYWYYNYSNNTDWVKAITRTGILQDHVLSIRGGGSKAQYYASIGYFGQTGTTIGTNLQRISTRINLDYNVAQNLKFSADFAYTFVDNDQLYASTVRNIAYRKMPNMSIYEYNAYGEKTPNYFSPESNIQGQYPGTYNPVAFVNNASNKQIGNRITPHFNIQYTIIPRLLTVVSDVQFDINSGKVKTILPQIATGRPVTETTVNRASDADYDGFTLATKTNLLYTPNLGEKHSLQTLISFQTNDYSFLNQGLMASNTASSYLDVPIVASRTSNDELINNTTNTQTRSAAILLNGQYGFLDRYLINLGIRQDGSSRFGKDHRYGYFPSASARWRLSGEPFMRKFSWLDDFSFRASYGQSGNMPNADYLYYSTYGNYTWNYLEQSGSYQQNIQLNNLKWETIIGKNIGLDISLFKSRISLTADIYRNRTKDMIYPNLSLMSYSGYSSISYLNAGTMDNQGWEIGFFSTPIKSKDWKVEFNVNLAHNENIIRTISDLYPRENIQDLTQNGVFKSMIQENNPFGSIYGYKYEGVYKDASETIARDKNGSPIIGPDGENKYMRFYYPSVDYTFQPGDAKYQDINHDGNIDYRDIVYLGNTNPKLTGGFGPTITYKDRLKITAFFSFRTGYKLINATEMYTTNMYSFDNQSTAVLRRWRKDGDVTDIPRAVYGYGYNWLGSSRYVQDASYLRWRTITVRYDLAPNTSRRLGLNALGFYLTAENIFTWTKYIGQDPEVTTRITSPFSVATDNSVTPPTRTVTIGISARL
ncbi:SusC/RagA family TonB-linked outer membrane protein [Rhizosphaericola mali]|uniref:SusC/RagA family TonB-linked outer membrane protein n=1 Tax=Rhizosphaericola mali TaxID=2545455 RepID=A0A5P2FXN5_9BACT|nr:SusC/RagA family TonB-linked outer membrane protein [Rhizosphaericola mali]QES88294.1 SusC/RagA family TonB-linked outer membrane protein [Rhizosphaericola mali]